MPFIDEKRSVQNLTNIAPEADNSVDPSVTQTFGAAFRTQNIVGSFLSQQGVANPSEVEDGFNPIDYVKDDPKYASYVEEFAGISNRRAADALKIQIDREEQDRRTLDSAGFMGVVAQMGAGVIDLPSLLPFGAAFAGGKTLAVAGRAAIGAGIDAAVSEVGLQATQATRTGEETALNIGGSILLGGALGTLAGRYLNGESTVALARKIEGQTSEFDAIDQIFSSGGGRSVGAAVRDAGPLVLKDEALISRLPLISQQDPLIRLQLGEMDAGRQTVRQLAETPLEYADNANGIATERGGSVETRMKMWHAPLAKSLRMIDTHFAQYFHGAPDPGSWKVRLSPMLSEFDRVRGGQKLTYKQFKEEVGRAAYMGGEHEIPEVRSAAAVYRKLDDELKQAAIDAKLFPEDVSVAGDISHRFRMYNKERIISDRAEFAKRLEDYYRQGQEAAGFRAEELTIGNKIVETDRVRDKFNQAFQRLDTLESRVAGRADLRKNKTEAIAAARFTRAGVMQDRAPEALVKALRGADENKAMISVVRESRAAARSANKKLGYAQKYPVLGLVKQKGGVRVGSKLDYELRSMDITPKTHPGLFRKRGGIGDVDNFVKSEDDFLADLPDDGNGYVDARSIMAAIRDEVGGLPLKSRLEIEAEAIADNLDKIASDWLGRVGLPESASVKEVRDLISKVIGAEKNLDDFDARISSLEGELEEFDKATDAIKNERDISASESRNVADHLSDLEASIDEVGDLANASPRVQLVVDYARAKRDLFKSRMAERNLKTRIDVIQRLATDGRATDEMLMELSAKGVDLERLTKRIEGLAARADRLQEIAPKKTDLAQSEEFANLSPGEVRSLVDETIDTILGNADGRIPYDIVAGPRGALKERVLKIATAKIHDFVENDIEHVMRAQIRTMSADVELAKKFGSVDLKDEILKINDEANAKIAKATTPKQRQSLEASRKAAVRDVEGIRDRLRGTYALPSNPNSLVLRAGRIARNVNYLRLLGGMTVSAIPDLGKVVFTHGLVSTFGDGFLPMVRNFKAFRLAAEEVKDSGTALDMVLDSRVMAMTDIMDDYGRHSKFERGLSSLSSRFGVVSLMAPWNASIKQFSGMVTMTNILKASGRVAAGTGTASDIRKLAASGIDEDLAQRISKQFADHGDNQSGVFLAGGENWTDRGALESFRAAIVRDVDRIVVTPGQDKPLWMSTELGKMVGQFKSFGISSMQKTTLAGLQQRDAATLNGVLVMMGLGAMTYALKQTLAGREVSDDPKQWAVEAFDKSGLAGWLMEVNNISEKATRGRVGLSAITGKQISRYTSRNVTGAFLGPTADAVSDIFQVSGSIFAGDTTQADLHKVRQLLPMQNLFYIRGILNQVEQATGEAIGLPDTRRK